MTGETIMKWRLNDFTKSGFANLIRPFENSLDDVIKTTRAFGIATKAHIGQFRDENKAEPYINHPLRVALILTEELHKYDVDLVCAALLHDVVEKGNQNKSITEDQIKKESSEHVYSMVRALTKPKMIPGQRERLLNEHFQSIRSASQAIRYVKLADELDNLRSLKNSSHKDKVLRYKQEAQRYIVPIAEHTDEKLVFKLSIAIYELK
jgi:(p)ppGpp synthase/HD superfamily hydrolase